MSVSKLLDKNVIFTKFNQIYHYIKKVYSLDTEAFNSLPQKFKW
jgi:hypothetical protein